MGLFTEREEETTNEIIIGKLNRIEAKLDAVIKAMHDYDGDDEYGESSFEAFMDAKVKDDMGGSNTQDKGKHVVGKKGKRKFNGNKNKG
jgi:hypothetical protein